MSLTSSLLLSENFPTVSYKPVRHGEPFRARDCEIQRLALKDQAVSMNSNSILRTALTSHFKQLCRVLRVNVGLIYKNIFINLIFFEFKASLDW